MLTIQCTKKLSEKLLAKLDNINSETTDSLYAWHANLFLLNRRNCVILMNNKTCFSIVLYGLKKKDFERFGMIVIETIYENLRAEGFDHQVIERYIKNAKDQIYTKTTERSVIGQMNDITLMTQYIVEDYILDKDTVNTIELNKCNNRSPMVKRKYCYAIDALKDALLNG